MKHFTMGELCASTTADVHGIKNTPPLQEAGNLKVLADNVLDPLREWYRKTDYSQFRLTGVRN